MAKQMLTFGECGCNVYENLYYYCNFSVSLKLFQNTQFLKLEEEINGKEVKYCLGETEF